MPQNHDPIAERAQEPTLPGFVAWLERKDPDEKYSWPISDICACGQYAQSIGVVGWIGNDGWSSLNKLARGPSTIGDHETASEKHWTFGLLLERCKKELEPVK